MLASGAGDPGSNPGGAIHNLGKIYGQKKFMGRRKLKAELLADLFYYKGIFNEEERNHAMLSIKIYYNGNQPPRQSSDFDRMYDFCEEYIIPYAERCSLAHLLTRKIN